MVQITVWEHQDFLWPASDRDVALRLPGIVSTKNKELKRALRLSRDPISLRQGSGGLLLRFAGVAGILNLVGYEFEIIPKFSFRQSASWQNGFFHMLSIAEYGHISFERSRHMGRGALSFCDHIALAFLESVEPALQKGPICAYRAAVSQGRYLRGRLLLPEQMRMLLTHPGEVVSEHDVFSPDNAFQYLLFWSAIGALEGEVRDLSLLRPLCALLGAWAGAGWLYSWTGGSLDGRFYPLDVILQAASLYFHFQLFTDLALLAARYQPEGADLDRHLLRLRTLQVLLLTGLALAGPLSDLCGGPAPWLSVALSLAGLLVSLALMNRLFALRRCFHPAP